MVVMLSQPVKSLSLPSKSLAAYCPFLLPTTKSELLTDRAVQAICDLATMLPPVPRIALEFRLREDEMQVDLQQQFLREHGVFPHLASFLETMPMAASGMHGLAAELQDDKSVLSRHVSEIFLEFDLPAERGTPLPSIFLSLSEDRAIATEIAYRAVEVLAGKGSNLHTAVERCITTCEGDAFVSGLGFMLGRTSTSLRINVKRLLPSTIQPYLEAIGYAGDGQAVARHFRATLRRTDRVTLALDLVPEATAATLAARVGLECYFDEQPTDDLLWAMTLGELCDEGLCSTVRARALMALPGWTQPSSTVQPWPMDLIAQSLAFPKIASRRSFANSTI